MTVFIDWIRKIFGAWKFWLVVKPWEIGVRVRLGKTAVALHPGLHFRVPLVDHVESVNTRRRVVSTPSVTLANGQRGYANVKTATVSFRIYDPLKAMMAYTDPEGVVSTLVQAEMVDGKDAHQCSAALAEQLDGIAIDFVRFVENVDVRTYRLLQSQWQREASVEKDRF